MNCITLRGRMLGSFMGDLNVHSNMLSVQSELWGLRKTGLLIFYINSFGAELKPRLWQNRGRH